MNVSEIIGLGAALVALAGLSVAIIYGDKTAKIISATGKSFSQAIKAATLQNSQKAR